KKIRATEGVAGELLCDLHHLFLINRHSVGRCEHIIDERIELSSFLATVFGGYKVVHHSGAKRTWSVERHHSDDIFKTVRLELAEELLHAARFELEHSRGFTTRDQLIGSEVLKREFAYDQRITLAIRSHIHESLGVIDHRERLEPEKVELDQTGVFDVVFVVLG